MPALQKIIVQDFRNIELQELDFSEGINCITGDNGEGKTNLLDAVYYLSTTRSAFAQSDRVLYRHGTKALAISGLYSDSGRSVRISVRSSEGEGGKKVLRDDVPYRKFSEHIGFAPVVMVSPSDSSLVSDSAEERRRFVNTVLSQMDREYLDSLQRYNRILAQRNALLKEDNPSADLLDAMDARMAPLSDIVRAARAEFAASLEPKVAEYYLKLSGGRETAGISYRTELGGDGHPGLMRRSRDRDLAMHYTTAGIQKDDFLFTMDGEPIRRVGSQGQQKSFLVSLKFAQFDLMSDRYGFPPILLLDDLFDKLDRTRTRNLLEMVSGRGFGQIFISDTDEDRMRDTADGLGGDKRFYHACKGEFSRV